MAATTALLLMAGMQAASTAANAYAKSKALEAQGDVEKSIQDANARYARVGAADAISRGDKAATRAKQAAKRMIGAQRAELADQGLDI